MKTKYVDKLQRENHEARRKVYEYIEWAYQKTIKGRMWLRSFLGNNRGGILTV